MSPYGFISKGKKDNDDDSVEVDDSSEEETTMTDEEITLKGEEALVNINKLIKDSKVPKVTKARLKQNLQQINHYVNKLKQSKTDTTPV